VTHVSVENSKARLNLKEVLVAQALQLVEREGAASVTLADVARLAGASLDEALQLIAGRDEVLRELSSRGFSQLAEAMAAAARGWADPTRGLHESGRAYVAFAVEHPNLFRLMLGPARPAPAAVAGDGRHALLQVLLDAITRARGPAALDVRAALPTWAAAHGLAMLLIDGQLAGLGFKAEDWSAAVKLVL
jgi:AcrR family transcriptional regulator